MFRKKQKQTAVILFADIVQNGNGRISPGRGFATNPAEVVRFKCD